MKGDFGDCSFLLDAWMPLIMRDFFNILYGVGLNSLLEGTYQVKKFNSELAQDSFKKDYFAMEKEERHSLLGEMGKMINP